MRILFACLFALAVAACSDPAARLVEPAEFKTIEQAEVRSDAPGAVAAQARRFVATRHIMTMEAPAADLHKQFDAIQAECLQLGCEILSVNTRRETPQNPPSATLIARLPPAAFDAFIKHARSASKLLEHDRESEDKTAEVIDVEAKIANLTALKGRVLELLAKNTGNLKETLEAEKVLAQTQAELDSINGQRKALAKQTDKVRVELRLIAQSLRAEQSWVAPVADALQESGRVLMSSLGALITFAVAALPWLLATGVLAGIIRRFWRKRKLNRS